MQKTSFRLHEKASVSVSSVVERRAQHLRPLVAAKAAGFMGDDAEQIHESDLTTVIVETQGEALKALDPVLQHLHKLEEVEPLGGGFLSARVGQQALDALIAEPQVTRVQSKKESKPHLDQALGDLGLVVPPGPGRAVKEDGTGVVIGVVDTGFDLSHPMFRDAAGRLRVDGLLDQTKDNRAYTRAQLESGWSGASKPGADANGHGTHVAAIAGGSPALGREGVAPGARFLLVKTDFRNTDRALAWVFEKAQNKPCVVNMSLGHHLGAHDGTDAEERLHEAITGPGRIVVISAGNERNDDLHVGGPFYGGQVEEVTFDVLRQERGAPFVIASLWYDRRDVFDVTLVTPGGAEVPMPALGNADVYQSSTVDIEFSARPYAWSKGGSTPVQVQIALSFRRPDVRDQDLTGWKLKVACRTAAVGRLDGWFHNSGYARFRAHRLLENARTVGLSATGDGCIAVASHISRNAWVTGLGGGSDTQAVVGRTSPFSSKGPTRDGRWKPEVSACGQYVTSALAAGSSYDGWDERADAANRVVTIEGTSMSAPMVAGVVALLLQKKPTLDVAGVRRVLSQQAKRDAHTGPAEWTPAYGHGKVDVARALAGV